MPRSFHDEIEAARFGVNRSFTTDKRFQPRYAAEVEVPTAAARFQAEADFARQLYPQVQELNALDPNIGYADEAFGRELQALGPSQLEQELNSQALSDLRLGGQLSAQQEHAANQGARAAFAARGLENSSPAAAAEILQRDAYSQALQLDRRNFALAADTHSNNRQNADRQFSITGMEAARSITDPRAEIFGPGGSAVSGQTAGARIGDMMPFVDSVYSQNSAQEFQGHQNNLDRAAATSLAQLQFGHQSALQEAQLAYEQSNAEAQRALSREEFAANQSASERNAQRNREAAADASRDSTVATVASSAVGIGLVLF